LTVAFNSLLFINNDRTIVVYVYNFHKIKTIDDRIFLSHPPNGGPRLIFVRRTRTPVVDQADVSKFNNVSFPAFEVKKNLLNN